MKKKLLVTIIGAGMLLTACAHTDNSSGEREQILDQLDPNRENKIQNTSDANDQLGFVNYKRNQLVQDREDNHVVSINRIQMADTIARLILRNEGFNQVATLVTDEHVLIAYDRDEGLSQETAADIASKTAVSLMPAYYDVYVTDNDNLIPDIQSLHNSTTTDKNYDNTINRIISEMQKTPQGIKHKEDVMD
jgi:Sporulation lipoprotein YhcN/YlaJ (Spore_YhcN_YlaJ)